MGKKVPIIQKGMVSYLLHHFDLHKSMCLNQIYLRVLRETTDGSAH